MSKDTKPGTPAKPAPPEKPAHRPEAAEIAKRKEIGGADGPEPTRYGDWQHKGRVSDF
jgi:homeobox protein ESX1